jgi:hypothetical protein
MRRTTRNVQPQCLPAARAHISGSHLPIVPTYPTAHFVDEGAWPHQRRCSGCALAQQRHAHHRVRLNPPVRARTDTSVRVRACVRARVRACVHTHARPLAHARARLRTQTLAHHVCGDALALSRMGAPGCAREWTRPRTSARTRARNPPCRSLYTTRLLERSVAVRPLVKGSAPSSGLPARTSGPGHRGEGEKGGGGEGGRGELRA